MATLGEDLHEWLSGESAITDVVSTRIHQNAAPETFAGTFVWFARAASLKQRAHDDGVGLRPFEEIFDVEAVGISLDDCETVIHAIRDLDGTNGSITAGGATVQAILIDDHDDDYVPRVPIASDVGLHVSTVELRVLGHVPV